MKISSMQINNNIIIHELTTGILIDQIIFTNKIISNLVHILKKNQDNRSLKDKIQHHISSHSNFIFKYTLRTTLYTLHKKLIFRRTALIQTTLDGAAQKWFSALPIDIKSDRKKFTQEFSKMFKPEEISKHQRILCNENCRLPYETMKQLAVRIETLVRKAYSLNSHDYKNIKMTEILMMTLTPKLRRIAIKKRASHPSSI